MTVQHKSGMTNRTIISAAVLSRWLRSSSLALPQKIPRSHRSKRWGNRRHMSFDGQEDMSNSPASIETWARSRVFPATDTALFFFSFFLSRRQCVLKVWWIINIPRLNSWRFGGAGLQESSSELILHLLGQITARSLVCMRRIHENADLQSSAVCFYCLSEPRMKVFFFYRSEFQNKLYPQCIQRSLNKGWSEWKQFKGKFWL